MEKQISEMKVNDRVAILDNNEVISTGIITKVDEKHGIVWVDGCPIWARDIEY